MQFLNNLSIRAKLALAFGLVLLLMLALGAAAWAQLARMNDQTEQILKYRVAGVRDAGRMVATATRLRSREFRIAVATGDQVPEAARLYDEALGWFDQADKDYASMIFDDAERKLYDDAHRHWLDYAAHSTSVVADAKAGNHAQALERVLQGGPKFDAALAGLNALVKYNDDGAMDDAQAAVTMYANSRLVIVGVLLVAAALATALGLAIARAIVRPLNQAVELAQAVAQGDLTQRVDSSFRDEIGALTRALGGMVGRLNEIVSDVRGSVDSVSNAASQIAAGNIDLSQRTEEQASNLQQTAASMEQLTSTVRLNADNARAASQLSQSARDVAARGGEVVGQVVATMERISGGSRKIADIIAVIDSIAFQTNILALNAAVEAARAGEQGRGFAVVAGEVRALAQRSASAAKEIKTLIQDSVASVESGSHLVEEAGKTMAEIVAQVQRVNDLVGEISSASTEQSQGIGQVGDAVSQLDQVTQQNAALVEESAAAAESLKHQAQRLAETVQVFRVAHTGAPGFATPTTASADRVGTGASATVGAPAKKPLARVAPAAPMALAPAGADQWATF